MLLRMSKINRSSDLPLLAFLSEDGSLHATEVGQSTSPDHPEAAITGG